MQVRRAVGEGNSLLLVLLVMLVFVPFPGFLISIKLVTIPDSPIFNPKCYVAPMHHELIYMWRKGVHKLRKSFVIVDVGCFLC